MSPRRRLLPGLLGAALALVLLAGLAPDALAAAGGGSSGFGGGGGFRGGGGSSGHGKGFALYLLFRLIVDIALVGHGLGLVVLVAVGLLILLYAYVLPRARAAMQERRSQGRGARESTRRRERRVELAAAEAAEQDPAFAPETVRAAASELWREVQAAWDRGDRAALAGLLTPSLLEEWRRRLDDFAARGWRNRVEPTEPPQIQYVGLRNAAGHEEGRSVVVRVEARLRDYVVDGSGRHIKRAGRPTETVRTREFWTLVRDPARDDARGGHDDPDGYGNPPAAAGWRLASIEQGAEGAHALSDRIIATPWADETALRDEALLERAAAEALPADVSPAEVAALDFAGDARAAALDLSLADGRFSPDVLEIAVRRAVAAWMAAIDGEDAALKAIADDTAVSEMLHPGDPSRRTRLVVRGLTVRSILITGLDAAAAPPLMRVEVELEGRRYIEDRATARRLQGSAVGQTRFTERWTFALTADAADPWRIRAAGHDLPVAGAGTGR